MGAKTWMLVCSDVDPKPILKSRPALDRAASLAFAERMFPSAKLTEIDDGSLSSTNPPSGELVVGCFPGIMIIAAKEFGIDYPSKLPREFLAAAATRSVYLHAMHSVVDWFAYAIWRDGRLERSLSLSPDSGVLEDIGERLPFEGPYWAGKHPAVDPEEDEQSYPLAFHPLELGEAALLDLFGYQLEGVGYVDPSLPDPGEFPLMRFKRSKSWWPKWR